MSSALPLVMLRDHTEVLVKQTRRGCLQELCGCEATNEFNIFPSVEKAKDSGSQFMYSLEESSFCCRLCCKNMRAFEQTVWSGTKDAKGSVIMTMSKPFTCGIAPMCCCMTPNMSFSDSEKAPLGTADVPCFCCIPAIKLKGPDGAVQYSIQQPACCGGLCVNCMAEGCCNCKIPFYVYAPGVSPSDGNQVGKIVKLWRGLGTEFFTDAASFRTEFPKGIDAVGKARILGTVFFVNILFFEKSE